MLIKFDKIGTKLILIVAFTVIFILAVFAYFSIKYQSDNLISEVERHVNQLSETIKHSTRFDMLANRREHVHNIINYIGNEPGIKNLRVLNKEGEIIYSIYSGEIGSMVDKKCRELFRLPRRESASSKIEYERENEDLQDPS
jgi:predicted PurR-regulated permease PerM